MVFREELTYDEIVDILDVKYVAASTVEYTLQAGIYEITDGNFMLMSLLLDDVKAKFAIDDVRLSLNLTTNETLEFCKKSFSTQN